MSKKKKRYEKRDRIETSQELVDIKEYVVETEVNEVVEEIKEEIVIDKKEEVKEVNIPVVTTYSMGKCRVVDKEIVVYSDGTERILEKGKTFFFDHMHTKGDKVYVSWNGRIGRNYTLLKDTKENKYPVELIG